MNPHGGDLVPSAGREVLHHGLDGRSRLVLEPARRPARSAIAMGKTLIHSDSTEYSRPILERSGFLAVSMTTPYNWER
jgi:hypothetical protein